MAGLVHLNPIYHLRVGSKFLGGPPDGEVRLQVLRRGDANGEVVGVRVLYEFRLLLAIAFAANFFWVSFDLLGLQLLLVVYHLWHHA